MAGCRAMVSRRSPVRWITSGRLAGPFAMPRFCFRPSLAATSVMLLPPSLLCPTISRTSPATGRARNPECRGGMMVGNYVLSHGYYDAYYLKAQKVRALIEEDFQKAFAEVDAIIAPVSPSPAFKIGEKIDDPMEMYLADIYTVTGDLAGIPCMSVPCGKTAGGLPVGMQILTKHFDETGMFRLADAFEKAGGFAG